MLERRDTRETEQSARGKGADLKQRQDMSQNLNTIKCDKSEQNENKQKHDLKIQD